VYAWMSMCLRRRLGKTAPRVEVQCVAVGVLGQRQAEGWTG
jgi:hypothetical protein